MIRNLDYIFEYYMIKLSHFLNMNNQHRHFINELERYYKTIIKACLFLINGRKRLKSINTIYYITAKKKLLSKSFIFYVYSLYKFEISCFS